MRITDSRYDRDRLRLAIAYRMIALRSPHPHHPAARRSCRTTGSARMYRDYVAATSHNLGAPPARQVAAADVVFPAFARARTAGRDARRAAALLRPDRPHSPGGFRPSARGRRRASATSTRPSPACGRRRRSRSSMPGTCWQVLCAQRRVRARRRCPDCHSLWIRTRSTSCRTTVRPAGMGSVRPARDARQRDRRAALDCGPLRRTARRAPTQRLLRTVSRSHRAPAQGRGVRRRGAARAPTPVIVPVWRVAHPGAARPRRLVGGLRRGRRTSIAAGAVAGRTSCMLGRSTVASISPPRCPSDRNRAGPSSTTSRGSRTCAWSAAQLPEQRGRCARVRARACSTGAAGTGTAAPAARRTRSASAGHVMKCTQRRLRHRSLSAPRSRRSSCWSATASARCSAARRRGPRAVIRRSRDSSSRARASRTPWRARCSRRPA